MKKFKEGSKKEEASESKAERMREAGKKKIKAHRKKKHPLDAAIKGKGAY